MCLWSFLRIVSPDQHPFLPSSVNSVQYSGVGGFALAAAILPVINADIGPSPYVIWVALAYTLTVSIGLLLVGRLSDIFGRRYFFISGSVLGLIGCIVCACAHTVGTVIGGTTLIGLGAASQISVVFVTAELVPVKHRFLANGFVYLWATPFTGMGPSISYAFLVHTGSWRGCYYLIIALNAFAVLCWTLLYVSGGLTI
jgi:MFS family permease